MASPILTEIRIPSWQTTRRDFHREPALGIQGWGRGQTQAFWPNSRLWGEAGSLALGEGLQEGHRPCWGLQASRSLTRDADPGGLHAGGSPQLPGSPRCAGHRGEGELPRSRGQSRRARARRGRRWRGPACTGGNRWARTCGLRAGHAGLEVTRPPRALFPRAPGSLPLARRFGRVSRAETGAAPAPGRRDAAWQRGGGSAASVPPAFVLAAACGARPGAMKGPSVCAPAAPLAFHS